MVIFNSYVKLPEGTPAVSPYRACFVRTTAVIAVATAADLAGTAAALAATAAAAADLAVGTERTPPRQNGSMTCKK